MKRVLGVLAGTDMRLRQIEAWAKSADVVLAADGGANGLHELGIKMHAAIGDFDSITPQARISPDEIVFNPDQDRSDCDKLLDFAQDRGYSAITLCNIEGDLLDHVLGTLQSAAKAKLEVRFALRRGLGYILRADRRCEFAAVPGGRLSLIPLNDCANVHLEGVFWSLSGQSLSPGSRLSLSNRVTEPQVSVRLDAGLAALFLFGDEYTEPSW